MAATTNALERMAVQIAKHATTPMFLSARPPTVGERFWMIEQRAPSRAYLMRVASLRADGRGIRWRP